MIGNRNHIPQLGAYSDRRYSVEYGQSFSPGYGRPPGSPFSFTGGAPHSPTSNSEQQQQQRRFSSTRFSAGCFARVGFCFGGNKITSFGLALIFY